MKPVMKINRVKLAAQKTRDVLMMCVFAALCMFARTGWAETVVWSDNFESPNVWDDWGVDNGTWEIGVPTYGPTTNSLGYRAHQGVQCAATRLNGNYSDNVTTRFVRLISFVVPPANQTPRLRFWQWFSFNAGDSGQVQLKEGTNAWRTVSTTYTTTSGGVWSRASVDLSDYAGKTVQIGFLFQSQGVICCSYNDVEAGWYIDEVSLVTGLPVFNSLETFELGWGDWSAESGTWEVGVPTGVNAFSGTNCAATVLNGNYEDRASGANGAASRFISPAFTVPSTGSNPRLKFWHWFAFNAGDSGKVQIKDGTNAWTTVSAVYVSNGGGVWTQSSIDLSAYAGKKVQLGFLFEAAGVVCCSYNETGPGWYIDDVTIVTGPVVFNNPENFEAGLGDWWSERGLWEGGVPTSGPTNANSGIKCAATVLSGNYQERYGSQNGVSSRLVSPWLTVPLPASNPLLRFWNWFAFNAGDSGRLQIKDGTNDWVTISPIYSGSGSGVWSRPAIDLSAYGGKLVQIAFLFEAAGVNCCAYNETAAGWYIDDFQVTGTSILSPIPDAIIPEQALWTYTPTVSGSGYIFSLSNAPSGMTVNPSTGTISWTPTEGQGPGTYSGINYIVSQSGNQVASQAFTVTVNEINTAPILIVPGPQLVYATTTLTVTNYATDSDIPGNTLAFGLVSAPTGVLLNPTTGVLTWTPTSGQAPNTYTIFVRVTDNGVPALSTTNSFSVEVKGLTAPSITVQPVSQVVGVGQSVTFSVEATGFPLPTYQWRRNGTNISGATGSSYLSDVIGHYDVVVSNSVNSVISSVASLTFVDLKMFAGVIINGTINDSYRVESMSILGGTNWITRTNIILATPTYIYIDYNSPTNAQQYYRAVPLP